MDILEKHGARLHIKKSHLEWADRWFERHGDATVFFTRMLPIIRTFISLPAGVARMPFWRFSLLTILGCIPWVLMLTFIGKEAGDNWERWKDNLHYVDYAVAGAIVIGVVWLVVRNRRRAEATTRRQVRPSRNARSRWRNRRSRTYGGSAGGSTTMIHAAGALQAPAAHAPPAPWRERTLARLVAHVRAVLPVSAVAFVTVESDAAGATAARPAGSRTRICEVAVEASLPPDGAHPLPAAAARRRVGGGTRSDGGDRRGARRGARPARVGELPRRVA